jgi:hypothetical protein
VRRLEREIAESAAMQARLNALAQRLRRPKIP